MRPVTSAGFTMTDVQTSETSQLIEQARAGDHSALGQLLHREQDRLYNLALRMVSHRDDAAEVTQQAMLKIVDQLAGFRGEASLQTWMRRILINEAYTCLRRRQARPQTSLASTRDGHPGDTASDPLQKMPERREPAPEERVQQKETAALLHEAIGQLDPAFRAVLVLRDVEQLDYPQIGEVLDLPAGTIKSRLFRARLALREAMEQLGY